MRKANVVKYLMNELQKGNIYIDNQGNLINQDEFIEAKTKLFVQALTEKRVPMNMTMDDFFKESGFSVTKTSDVLLGVQKLMGNLITKEMKEKINEIYGLKKEGDKDAKC